MTESYGNIENTTLQEALNHPDFKKYWNITKDQISVCKDCEFRHICTDCCAYVENPDDIVGQTALPLLKNPLKEKATKHYNLEKQNIINI